MECLCQSRCSHNVNLVEIFDPKKDAHGQAWACHLLQRNCIRLGGNITGLIVHFHVLRKNPVILRENLVSSHTVCTVASLSESRLLMKNHRQSYNTHTQQTSLSVWVKVGLTSENARPFIDRFKPPQRSLPKRSLPKKGLAAFKPFGP